MLREKIEALAIKIERYMDYSKLYQIQYIDKQYVAMYLTT